MTSSGCCFSGISTLICGSRSQEERRPAELRELLEGVISTECQRAVHGLEDGLLHELQSVLQRLGQDDLAPSIQTKRRRQSTEGVPTRQRRERFFTAPADEGTSSCPMSFFAGGEDEDGQPSQPGRFASEGCVVPKRDRSVSCSSSRAGSKSSVADTEAEITRNHRSETWSEGHGRSSLSTHHELLDLIATGGSRREHADGKGRLKHRFSHRDSNSSLLDVEEAMPSVPSLSLPSGSLTGSMTPASGASPSPDWTPRSHPTEEEEEGHFAHTPKKVRRSSSGWRHDALDVGAVKAMSSGQRKLTKKLSLIGLLQSERERWIDDKQALEDRLQELKARQQQRQKELQDVDTEKQELKQKLQELREAVTARSRFGAWLCKKHMEESDDEEAESRTNVKEKLRSRIDELQAKLTKARAKAASDAGSEAASSSGGKLPH